MRPPVGVRSIEMSMSVCLCVRLSVCASCVVLRCVAAPYPTCTRLCKTSTTGQYYGHRPNGAIIAVNNRTIADIAALSVATRHNDSERK